MINTEYSTTITCGATQATFLTNARNPVDAVRQSFAGFVEKHRCDLSEIEFSVSKVKPKSGGDQ